MPQANLHFTLQTYSANIPRCHHLPELVQVNEFSAQEQVPCSCQQLPRSVSVRSAVMFRADTAEPRHLQIARCTLPASSSPLCGAFREDVPWDATNQVLISSSRYQHLQMKQLKLLQGIRPPLPQHRAVCRAIPAPHGSSVPLLFLLGRMLQ